MFRRNDRRIAEDTFELTAMENKHRLSSGTEFAELKAQRVGEPGSGKLLIVASHCPGGPCSRQF